MNKLSIIRRIVENSQAEKVVVSVNGKNRKILLDGLTANAILSLYNALSNTSKEKLMDLDWPRLISVTWKLIK